ncbi:MAG: DUF438 domain-containing protein [Sphaerochaeta sp.]|uniref:DUF438 domain-containing protein n=1 Tax=Sphaerochaeta sp. TaxID=1972642 RepID=UPI001D507FEA|nr:DUF438 domain-containing protein [Sphaerochaeta sp.]MDD3928413.1 DUF438 domain-containing protein [Sphaerochaeta sp.]NCC12314.1 DUF438 domain-containing protein [Spirochaetia bacterium]NCC88751.1 DUF438 domain-containing protein [Spirochaetia bacterium]
MDEQKIVKLKAIIERLHAGVSSADVKKEFEAEFGSVSAEELAAAERKLMEDGEIQVEQVQKLCDVHASVFGGSVEEIHQGKQVDKTPGHPAFVFIKENEGLKAFLDGDFAKAVQTYKAQKDENSKLNLLAALKTLSSLEKHYLRKENLFFPYLEKAGITAPPKVMWGVDDEIRALWKLVIRTLESSSEVLEAELAKLEEQVRSMIDKENNILLPMLQGCMDGDAWLTVGRDSADIGYCFNGGIEGASPSDATTWYRWNASMSGKEDFAPKQEDTGEIVLPSGHMSLDELTWMLNTLPGDVTFVGVDDKVRYFSEGKDRVFPRTRSIVGRDVAHCHPPKSLKVVEKLVEDFKAGRKDSESFWIQKGTMFILIRYFAVRNEHGEYLGVLEVTEEISSLRSLEGQKTLLSE